MFLNIAIEPSRVPESARKWAIRDRMVEPYFPPAIAENELTKSTCSLDKFFDSSMTLGRSDSERSFGKVTYGSSAKIRCPGFMSHAASILSLPLDDSFILNNWVDIAWVLVQ